MNKEVLITGFFSTLKNRARALKQEMYALLLAVKDPRVPWYAKVLVYITLIYALSPIDLIPDFIPILGYLDDIIIVPLGIFISISLIPKSVLDECRIRSALHTDQDTRKKQLKKWPLRWVGLMTMIAIWVLAIWWAARLFFPDWYRNFTGWFTG